MRKIILAITILVFVGCGRNQMDGKAKPTFTVGISAQETMPVKVVNDANDMLPIKIAASNEIPVRIRPQEPEGMPIRIQADPNMKLIVILLLVAAMGMCLTAVFAAVCAYEAKQSAKAAKKAAEMLSKHHYV